MSGTSNQFECTTEFETFDIVIGFVLSVGIFLSFLPQILVLIFRKNVEGLSVVSCWFNYANCMATFLNILFLNWFVFECCHNWMTSWVCFENLLPVVQMTVPFVTTGVIFGLYVIYRPKLPPFSELKKQIQQDGGIKDNEQPHILNHGDGNENPSRLLSNIDSPDLSANNSMSSSGSGSSGEGTTPILKSSKPAKRELDPNSFLLKEGNNRIEKLFIRMDWYSQPFFWGTNAFTVVFFFIGLAICLRYGSKSGQLEGYAFSMGVLASVLVFFQWMPQIYTTWISNEIGSLSLVSLCIQIPGALLVCYFQLASKQSWITWFPYLATAVQETILAAICFYYIVRDKKAKKALLNKDKKPNVIENNNNNENNNGENNNRHSTIVATTLSNNIQGSQGDFDIIDPPPLSLESPSYSTIQDVNENNQNNNSHTNQQQNDTNSNHGESNNTYEYYQSEPSTPNLDH